jgi:tRNA (mo5U34)-methyltransferase
MASDPARREPPTTMSREERLAIVQAFSYWYHRIYLGDGVYTLAHPAYHEEVWPPFLRALPEDLGGCSVLDVGANAGFFSLQTKLLGAGRVLGVEFWPEYLRQAELCRQVWGLDIEYRNLDAHRIDTIVDEEFDLVVFLGVLYHLKHPFYVIEQIGRLCRDAVLIETEIIADDPANSACVRLGPLGQVKSVRSPAGIMKFFETDEANGDASNWWAPDRECLLGMLRVAGFKYFSKPVLLYDGHRMALIATKHERSLVDRAGFGVSG